MRPLTILLPACLFLSLGPLDAVSPPVRAADGAQERRISLDLRDVPLRKALTDLFRDAGLPLEIRDIPIEVPDVPISLSLRDLTAPAAARTLVRAASGRVSGLVLTRDGEKWIVRILPIEERQYEQVRRDAPDPRLNQQVMLEVTDVPLRAVLQMLFQATKVRHSVAESVPELRVDLEVRNGTVFDALWKLLDALETELPELTVTRHRGEYLFAVTERNPLPAVVIRTLRTRRVTLELKETPFRQALEKVMAGSNLQYIVHPNLPPGLPVDLDLRDVTLEEALNRLIRAAQPGAPGLRLRAIGEVLILERHTPRP
jgi:hypothetical protein